jgi:hypothetical protein
LARWACQRDGRHPFGQPGQRGTSQEAKCTPHCMGRPHPQLHGTGDMTAPSPRVTQGLHTHQHVHKHMHSADAHIPQHRTHSKSLCHCNLHALLWAHWNMQHNLHMVSCTQKCTRRPLLTCTRLHIYTGGNVGTGYTLRVPKVDAHVLGHDITCSRNI